MAVLTGFVIMFFADGFKGKVYHDNTHLFAVNTEGCPTTIEKEYELSVLPEEYELCDTDVGDAMAQKVYKNNTGEKIISTQYIKNEFNLHINTEEHKAIETSVNGCNAVYIDFNNKNVIVVWDNIDYILEVSGDFNKNEAIKLAELNEITGF